MTLLFGDRYVLTVVVDNQKFIRPLRNKIGGLPKEARASLSAHFADQIDSAFPMISTYLVFLVVAIFTDFSKNTRTMR